MKSKIVLMPPPEVAIESTYPNLADETAFAGLAGEYVQAIEPVSEADPFAILSQVLVMFGNIIGTGPHFMAEQDTHHLNEYVAIVGATSEGRKGVSIGHARRAFQVADDTWQRASGLSSPEGLIYAVRDASEKMRQGKGKKDKPVPEDPGVKDKRLMVEETEFASVLHRMRREANTLSTVMRQAWDSGNLRVLTKHSPVRATGAHISLVTHITVEELKQCLSETDVMNGFANRFLWVCTRRSKLLPDGGALDLGTLVKFCSRFDKAVRFARGVGEMRRTEKAKKLWHERYRDLTAGHLGFLGKVTSRAAPHVMRLACLYALLDHKKVVERRHLESALAFWDYCVASARHIFGDHVGNVFADKVLTALREQRPNGLSRTALITDVGRNHYTAEQLEQALRELLNAGWVRRARVPTKGRTAERWFAV